MALEISSRDAERIARRFNDLIKPKGLTAIRRRAVTDVGAGLRKDFRAIGPALYGTSAAALSIQGKAPAPGDENPAYRLRMASSFPVGKLRASLRKVTREGERRSLTLTPPHQGAQRFARVEREGRAFRLLAAGSLAERFLGGVSTRARRAFADEGEGGLPELASLRKRAEAALPEAVARRIDEALARMRR